MTEVTQKHSWKYRRRFMFVVSAFAGALTLLALLVRPDAPVAGTSITGGLALLGSIVGCYVFGATWDDKGRS